MTYEEMQFLIESNHIENERSDDALGQAIFAWEYIKEQEALTPSIVLQTHKILMLHLLVGMYKGYFRQEPIFVGGREGKPWYVVPELIENWCIDMNDFVKRGNSKDEETIKALHVRYETIHPFFDGNGRTGRIFMNWQRVKMGLPICVILESEKEKYYEWFN